MSDGVHVESIDDAPIPTATQEQPRRGPGRPRKNPAKGGSPKGGTATAAAPKKQDHRVRTGEEQEIDKNAGGRPITQRVDNPHSPTGKSKARILLRSYLVKGSRTVYVQRGNRSVPQREVVEVRIEDVPGQSHAIREFLLLQSAQTNASDWQCQAVPLDDEPRDAGETGYRSTHIPQELAERRARANRE